MKSYDTFMHIYISVNMGSILGVCRIWNSKSVNQDHHIELVISWGHGCQPFRSNIRKFKLTSRKFYIDFFLVQPCFHIAKSVLSGYTYSALFNKAEHISGLNSPTTYLIHEKLFKVEYLLDVKLTKTPHPAPSLVCYGMSIEYLEKIGTIVMEHNV